MLEQWRVLALRMRSCSGTPAPPPPPSHLCAVEPRGRQLLPLIITPNGWIHFLLTSSSWHNIIPTVHRPNTPSSRQRPSRIPDPTWPDGQQWRRPASGKRRMSDSKINVNIVNLGDRHPSKCEGVSANLLT